MVGHDESRLFSLSIRVDSVNYMTVVFSSFGSASAFVYGPYTGIFPMFSIKVRAVGRTSHVKICGV